MEMKPSDKKKDNAKKIISKQSHILRNCILTMPILYDSRDAFFIEKDTIRKGLPVRDMCRNCGVAFDRQVALCPACGADNRSKAS